MKPSKLTKRALLIDLLKRPEGATAFDICAAVGSTCPHKRISELKEVGWTINRTQVTGKDYGVYRGIAPRVF